MSRTKVYLIALPIALVLGIGVMVLLADRHVTSAVPWLESIVVRWIVGIAVAWTAGRLVRRALVGRVATG